MTFYYTNSLGSVDLEEVRAHRSSNSRSYQAAKSTAKYYRVETSFELSPEEDDLATSRAPSRPIQPRYHSPEEEIALATGSYLWDYLRRSGTAGYLVPYVLFLCYIDIL